MPRKHRFASSLGIALATTLAIATTLGPAAVAAPAYYAFTGVVDTDHSEYAGLTTFNGLFSFDLRRPISHRAIRTTATTRWTAASTV